MPPAGVSCLAAVGRQTASQMEIIQVFTSVTIPISVHQYCKIVVAFLCDTLLLGYKGRDPVFKVSTTASYKPFLTPSPHRTLYSFTTLDKPPSTHKCKVLCTRSRTQRCIQQHRTFKSNFQSIIFFGLRVMARSHCPKTLCL